jgi:hypothetical protein
MRERRENRVREEKKSSGNDAVWLSFGPARTGPVPDPTRPVPDPYREIFFLGKKGYAWGTHAAVPRQYPYPRGTRYEYGAHFAVPVLLMSPKVRNQMISLEIT